METMVGSMGRRRDEGHYKRRSFLEALLKNARGDTETKSME